MTQLRDRPDAISSRMDRILRTVGPRGTGFIDIDAVTIDAITHDRRSNRFLVQEFKYEGSDDVSDGQWETLHAFKCLPMFTVWIVVLLHDGRFGVTVLGWAEEILTELEYRAKVNTWWLRRPCVGAQEGGWWWLDAPARKWRVERAWR